MHALQGIDLMVDAGAMVAVMGRADRGIDALTIVGSLEDPSRGEVASAGRS